MYFEPSTSISSHTDFNASDHSSTRLFIFWFLVWIRQLVTSLPSNMQPTSSYTIRLVLCSFLSTFISYPGSFSILYRPCSRNCVPAIPGVLAPASHDFVSLHPQCRPCDLLTSRCRRKYIHCSSLTCLSIRLSSILHQIFQHCTYFVGTSSCWR